MFSRFVAVLCISAAALLAACGGSQPPIGALGEMPQSRVIATQAKHAGSWTLPAKGSNLLYVTDGYENVYVYEYPQGKLVGMLTGFIAPLGECADSNGDVFIVAAASKSYSSSVIYEYAHGGSNPVKTLEDPVFSGGCAVDPRSGDLAVAGVHGVAVYQSASGDPTMFYNNAFSFFNCGYDKDGNLYLSGSNGVYGNQSQLIRLANGSSTFEQINLDVTLYTNESGPFLPSVQWDGKHVTVSSTTRDQEPPGPASVYRLKISGSSASAIGTTTLQGEKDHFSGQLVIRGKTIIGGTYYKGHTFFSRWSYPHGGQPRRDVRTISDAHLWGVAVSVAPSR